MTSMPELPYRDITRALQRDGWVIVRQRGSHILKQAEVDLDKFLKLI